MIDKVLKFIIPHHCCRCQKVGAALCQDCINYIIPRRKNDPKLTKCQESWLDWRCFGWRSGLLEKIVDDYKFNLKRELANPLAQLLASQLRDLTSESVVVVPIPTTGKHNRQRGLDHMKLIGKELAKLLGGTCEPILQRASQVSQRGLQRGARLKNAQTSFKVSQPLDEKKTYLVIDDVWTTGATIITATELLKKHGAKKVVAAVICRQPVDKKDKALKFKV
ncbi:MAG: ComF family protein [Candidatus Nanosyncoccaceae bacterium]|jgi:ComF family protein